MRKRPLFFLVAISFLTLSLGRTQQASACGRFASHPQSQAVGAAAHMTTLNGSLSAGEGAVAQGPVDDARLAKNKRYDAHGRDLTKLEPGEQIFNQTWPRTEFIPVSQSAVVVLGRAIRIQAYLSEDRSRIYTEITVKVETVFKNKTNNLPSSDEVLDIDFPGGTVQLPSGQVVHDDTKIEFLGKPYVGGRFVLFAVETHGGKDLTLIRGYELRDSRVFELTEDGTPGTKLISTTPGVSATLSDEGVFLQEIRTQAAKAVQAH